MQSMLADAHTWFLESYEQGPHGDLVIRLVEGIKGTERLPVVIGEQALGTYFPVTIEPRSRCVRVTFPDLRALCSYTEGYDAEDPKMELGEGKFLRPVLASSFREFTAATTTAIDEFRGQFSEWLVWSEDHIFQVLAGGDPQVQPEAREPDFSIQRGETWSAS
jgi:hypothetical protein